MRFSFFRSGKKDNSRVKDAGKDPKKPENKVVTYTKGGARGVRKVYSEKEDRTPGDRRIGVDWRYLGRALTQFGVVLVSLAAVFYFGYHLVRVLMPGITVSDVVTISETYRCSGSAYLFCDSVPVKAKSAGFADYQVSDGQRVAKGDAICSIYAEDRSGIREELDSLDAEIAMLRRSAGGEVTREGIAAVMADISGGYSSIMNSLSSGDYISAGAASDGLRASLARKLYLTGGDGVIADRLNALVARRSSVFASLGSPAEKVTAGSQGYFFRSIDGREGVFTLKLAEELTEESFLAALDAPPVTVDGCVGRLSYSPDWYLAVRCEGSEMTASPSGRDYTVSFPDTGAKPLRMTLEKKIRMSGGGLLLLFRGNSIPSDFGWLRCQTAEIEYMSVEGYRVPVSAVHQLDGYTGVYTVDGGYARFRRTVTLAEGEGYYIVKKYEDALRDDPPETVYRHIPYGFRGRAGEYLSIFEFAEKAELAQRGGSDGGVCRLAGGCTVGSVFSNHDLLTMKRNTVNGAFLAYGEQHDRYDYLRAVDELILSGRDIFHGKVID